VCVCVCVCVCVFEGELQVLYCKAATWWLILFPSLVKGRQTGKFGMSSTLPQFQYFKERWKVPLSGGWVLSGHSRALERTGFLLSAGPLTLVLDAGVGAYFTSSVYASHLFCRFPPFVRVAA